MVGKRFGGLERVGERPGAGQEMKDGKEGRGERQKGRVRAETGAEMSRRKPGQHILPPETDLCYSYKWELFPLQS